MTRLTSPIAAIHHKDAPRSARYAGAHENVCIAGCAVFNTYWKQSHVIQRVAKEIEKLHRIQNDSDHLQELSNGLRDAMRSISKDDGPRLVWREIKQSYWRSKLVPKPKFNALDVMIWYEHQAHASFDCRICVHCNPTGCLYLCGGRLPYLPELDARDDPAYVGEFSHLTDRSLAAWTALVNLYTLHVVAVASGTITDETTLGFEVQKLGQAWIGLLEKEWGSSS